MCYYPPKRKQRKEKNQPKPFSKEDDETIRKFAKSCSARQIGEMIGRTRGAVLGRAFRLDISVGLVRYGPKEDKPEPPQYQTPSLPKLRFLERHV